MDILFRRLCKMKFIAQFCAALTVAFTNFAFACGDEPFIGEVCTFAFHFCPQGYVPADGRVLPISSNQALFSLLGTSFGGDGRVTFYVPDLRGRSVVGTGSAPTLTPSNLGDARGSETITIMPTNLPVQFTRKEVKVEAEQGTKTTATVELMPGQNQPISITPPQLALTYCIATRGRFPSRP